METRSRALACQVALAVALAAGAEQSSALAQSGRCELTWVEAIEQALEANQALVAARQSLDAQHKDVAIARSKMLPAIGVGSQAQISEGPTFSSTIGLIPERTINAAATLSWTLYDHADIDALGSQKHLYESQRQSYEVNRLNTTASAAQSYLNLLLQQALVLVQELNLDLTGESLEVTSAQEAAGAVPYREVLRWESQRFADRQSIATQQGDLLASRFALNQVRNRPAEEVCTLEEVTVDEHGFLFSSEAVTDAIADESKAAIARDYLVELGLAQSPTLRGLDAQIRAEWRQMKSTRRWMIPSFTGGAGGAAFLLTAGEGADQQPAGNIFWRMGLQLDWSILDGGYYIASMNQAKAQFGSLQWQRDFKASALEQDIRGTAAKAMASFAVIALAEQRVQTAKKNYQLVNEAYLDGAAMFLELIDSQQSLLAASIAARQALYQFLSDLVTLEQSMAYYPFFEPHSDARVRELEATLRQ
ncbi:MAG: TolC family protein [Deltaproteobacteria bacterium]|nr:TolC family protein [Deltaproteobacteria bacterium]NND29832.1 TolC family protein [Myxococcales bacterium]MBT8463292.1 TolC family protein [Deltaproteobacteria bacterium]MBT8482755.1 TolC family protein [Deltaproteobacteria bacterium]NNK06754.1 TolC family protein [Myxococcales bacterium]